jgi:hypothetical protein
MASFPKLGLPAQQRPAATAKAAMKVACESPPNIQPYAASIYELVAAEMERVGKGAANAAVFAAVMDRLSGDEALFRRLATTLLHKEVIRRIKRIRRRSELHGGVLSARKA